MKVLPRRCGTHETQTRSGVLVNRLKNTVLLLVAELCLLMLLGCEVGTSVRLEAGLSFSLDGSGRLVSFSVYGPQPGHKIATPLDAKSLMWSIEPTKDSPLGALVTSMDLAYGRVPKGYVQTFPSSGAAIPPAAGQVYALFAETTGAPGADRFFCMDKNAPILVNVPGLCQSALVGDVKPVKCGTNEPYVEPKDLEKFVQENRVQK
jgi:hypothetical protein